MEGRYSNIYYPTRWVPLRRRLGWQKCNDRFRSCNCVASCGLIDGKLEIVLDLVGCNLDCKYCWCWKARNSQPIVKSVIEVVRDILCRSDKLLKDVRVAKSKYRLGVVRITGNEPTLQWEHVLELVKLLGSEKLFEIAEKYNFDDAAVESVLNSKIIIETNGLRLAKLDVQQLEMDKRVDLDVSFKGVNERQFEWLSSRSAKLFDKQIEGFAAAFDNAPDNVEVTPCLGINHHPNYCVWRRGEKYVMDVEIVDARGEKLDFEDYSKRFEEEVLGRKSLRTDEAPFREYFGINRERARMVVAVVYNGVRYLHVLPSEVPDLVRKFLNVDSHSVEHGDR
ncbi:MAG: radical SAM protein [Archaeoglobaceae archaeon]